MYIQIYEEIIFLCYQFQASVQDVQRQVDEGIANNRRLRKPTEKMIQAAVSNDENEPNEKDSKKEKVNSTLHGNYMLNYIYTYLMFYY